MIDVLLNLIAFIPEEVTNIKEEYWNLSMKTIYYSKLLFLL